MHTSIVYKKDWLKNAKIKAITLDMDFSELVQIAVDNFQPNISQPQNLELFQGMRRRPPINPLEIDEWVKFMNCIENVVKVEKLIPRLSKKVDYQRRRIESETRKRKTT